MVSKYNLIFRGENILFLQQTKTFDISKKNTYYLKNRNPNISKKKHVFN